MEKIDYPMTIRKMHEEEGSGWVVEFPDIPDCIGTGTRIEEAVECAHAALESWLTAAREFKLKVPAGRFVQRVPKSLHAELIARAKKEGVSLNTLVLTLIAQGLGRKLAVG